MSAKSLQEIERETYKESIEGRNVHDNLKSLSVEELREEVQKDRFPFHVMCLSLTGDLNIGSIIRSSILHGAEKVWIFGRRRYDKRGPVGAHNYIDVETIHGFENDNYDFDFDKFEEIIDKNNLYPIFIEQGGIELQNVDWVDEVHTANILSAKPILVFGNETNGIPDAILKKRPRPIVSVPQRGVIRSFNVSSTMALVTWDMRRAMGWF